MVDVESLDVSVVLLAQTDESFRGRVEVTHRERHRDLPPEDTLAFFGLLRVPVDRRAVDLGEELLDVGVPRLRGVEALQVTLHLSGGPFAECLGWIVGLIDHAQKLVLERDSARAGSNVSRTQLDLVDVVVRERGDQVDGRNHCGPATHALLGDPVGGAGVPLGSGDVVREVAGVSESLLDLLEARSVRVEPSVGEVWDCDAWSGVRDSGGVEAGDSAALVSTHVCNAFMPDWIWIPLPAPLTAPVNIVRNSDWAIA